MALERELILEIGCEELPASWLPGLTEQLALRVAARLKELRLSADVPVETYSTPRRLTARVERLLERQADREETITGPPVTAAFDATGAPTQAALGFARKQGVEVSDLAQVETPRGLYLAYHRRERSRTAVDVLPDVLGGILRDLTFPKNMRWDAQLEDGRGELLFGRPIRWILFLYGGRVVPFTIKRTAAAQSSLVQDVRSGAVTYGHRFLATTGRPGRAIKVRTFEDYRARLAEHFVVLDRGERRDRIGRDLELHARRLGGRVRPGAGQAGLLDEVPDLVEYPAVIAGTFPPDFLELPQEVLTTTMIHHQHYFPVVDDAGRLKPAFLAVTNTQPDNARAIARNAERVLAARLRDAQFFWHADRAIPLAARLDRLETVLFHAKAGTYREKAVRIGALAEWIAGEALEQPAQAEAARIAGRLAKADLTTDMVREFTELQGTMGGIYGRTQGQPEPIWKAIYYHYLPVGVEEADPPSREDLGEAAVTWVAVALADKLDTIVALHGAGERPSGTRDPFGLRRQAHGLLKILVDLPRLTGLEIALEVGRLIRQAELGLQAARPSNAAGAAEPESLHGFLIDRLRHLFTVRGFRYDELNAVFAGQEEVGAELRPLDLRLRLEALRALRGSDDLAALAVLFRRVKNIARELPAEALAASRAAGPVADRLTEPTELALLAEIDRRSPAIAGATGRADYLAAATETAELRPAVDRFFTDVFVMVDDPALRQARLRLMADLRDMVLQVADISELVPPAAAS